MLTTTSNNTPPFRFPMVPTQHIVVLYVEKHLTMEQISKLTGMSKVAVCKRLKKAGIKASQGTWFDVQCSFCAKAFKKPRSRFNKTINHFCSKECYFASMESPGTVLWRHGQRLARALVGTHYRLEPAYIVHHKDGNDRNNDLSNLQVIDSNANHLKNHRSGTAKGILWDGSTHVCNCK